MEADYRESHKQPGKGEDYHAAFTRSPYRRIVWDREKRILDAILSTHMSSNGLSHLDFACGTGRILNYVGRRARASVGVDVSPAMLEVARRHSPNAEIIEADLTKVDVLGDRRFDLITAFRFFANAQPELRSQAMQVLAAHLAENGVLVFNNHKQTGSTRNRLARLIGRRGFKGMSVEEMEALVQEAKLKTVQVYALCIFPASESRLLLPSFILGPIEDALAMVKPLRWWGENLIFVCRPSKTQQDY